MNLPFFYISEYDPSQKRIVLDEENSKHIIQVLRMKKGEKLNLTDGKGNLITAEIIDDHKKHCTVKVEGTKYKAQGARKISIGISLLKNANRFEWFLEKATEIGVNEIIPLICKRTEKQKIKKERIQNILISALLQSQQVWLPEVHDPKQFNHLTIQQFNHQQKFIAHCADGEKRNLNDLVNETLSSQIILIGPEGDFTSEEIQLAVQNHFDAVSLGDTRLRAETAGMVAATLLRMH